MVSSLLFLGMVGGCRSEESLDSGVEAKPYAARSSSVTSAPTKTVTVTETVTATESATSSTTVTSSSAKPAAKTTTQPAAAPPATSQQSTTTQCADCVYYENCDAARAAGAAPIYRGEPGYAKHLDRDNDGIACEVATKTTKRASSTKPAQTQTQPQTKAQTQDVYYKNCSEARAAGAAPIYRGEPGYRKGLDRDNDGIACE